MISTVNPKVSKELLHRDQLPMTGYGRTTIFPAEIMCEPSAEVAKIRDRRIGDRDLTSNVKIDEKELEQIINITPKTSCYPGSHLNQ